MSLAEHSTTALVASVSTIVIGLLLDIFARPYIETRKTRITRKKLSINQAKIETSQIIIILDLLIQDIDNIKQGNSNKLIPTVRNIHSNRIDLLIRSLNNSINLASEMQIYHEKYEAMHYVDYAINAIGGLERIKDNVKNNNITGQNSLTGTNLRSLKEYRTNIYNLTQAMPQN